MALGSSCFGVLFLGSGSTFGSQPPTNLCSRILPRHCRSFDRSRAAEGRDSRNFPQPGRKLSGSHYEWCQEPARKAGVSARRRKCLPRFWGERRISVISTVADQSHRSGHAQPKCLHDLQNACEAGALVLGRLIALHLLRLDPKAAR
jgi:hypothetical protein